eukprot:scaffold14308_cov68-Phaeocystis_antarctica.AAC.5
MPPTHTSHLGPQNVAMRARGRRSLSPVSLKFPGGTAGAAPALLDLADLFRIVHASQTKSGIAWAWWRGSSPRAGRPLGLSQ